MQKAFFFDRDGVLNKDRGGYTYLIQDFVILPGIIPLMRHLKHDGFLNIVVTNQAGIAKGIYTREQVQACHDHFQQVSGHLVDSFYYAPDHPDFSESLSRKPGSLMFERAIARYGIDPSISWMIGDMERDILPAQHLGMKTILLSQKKTETVADYVLGGIEQVLDLLGR
ncbi:MAG: HAD-IIIA family hydrolase [Bacteroidota bacterium]